MIGSMACDSGQMPGTQCIAGPGLGPTKGANEPAGTWWTPTDTDKGVQGQWSCNSDGTSTFTPGSSGSTSTK